MTLATFDMTQAAQAEIKPAETAITAAKSVKARPPRRWRILLGLGVLAAIGFSAAATLWATVRPTPTCACVLPPIHSLRPVVMPSNQPTEIKALRP